MAPAFMADFWRDVSYYDAALMNGVPNNTASDTNDLDTNDGKDFVGRIFLMPFEIGEHEYLKGLGFGFAGARR